mmetsp:Transcript_62744/g.166522  ORF Transcript_62744/g.166522 Transcript_62744/m.166522 type:complete len:204 (-) Transcript_62744:36-647(-)
MPCSFGKVCNWDTVDDSARSHMSRESNSDAHRGSNNVSLGRHRQERPVLPTSSVNPKVAVREQQNDRTQHACTCVDRNERLPWRHHMHRLGQELLLVTPLRHHLHLVFRCTSISGHRVPLADVVKNLKLRCASACHRRRCCDSAWMREQAFMGKHVVQPLRKEAAMQRHSATVGFGDLPQPSAQRLRHLRRTVTVRGRDLLHR